MLQCIPHQGHSRASGGSGGCWTYVHICKYVGRSLCRHFTQLPSDELSDDIILSIATIFSACACSNCILQPLRTGSPRLVLMMPQRKHQECSRTSPVCNQFRVRSYAKLAHLLSVSVTSALLLPGLLVEPLRLAVVGDHHELNRSPMTCIMQRGVQEYACGLGCWRCRTQSLNLQ